MSEENETSTPETPGHILKTMRIKSDFTIEHITAETKISASVIRAMEEDDFSKLPAPAFTKGFYSLYASTLGLDGEELVALYQTLHGGKNSGKKKDAAQNDVGALTKRPFVPIFSLIGFTLLLLLLIFGTISWYFSWNPADFLSQQLRGVETEYHEKDTKGIDLDTEETVLTSTNVDTVKINSESEPVIQFPAARNTQGIEINELNKNIPELTLTAPSITPTSILTEPTPQPVLQ